MTETAVTLRWTCPQDDGGCAITSYIIEYNRVSLPFSLFYSFSSNERLELADGLGHVAKSGHFATELHPSRRSDPWQHVRLPSEGRESLRSVRTEQTDRHGHSAVKKVKSFRTVLGQ